MKTKTILILALAACFAFAGCSEDNGDSFKPAETVPASQTTMTSDTTNASESSESQTETTTETTTESTTTTTEPTTTTEAETTTTKPAANKLTASATIAGGKVIVEAVADPNEGSITITLDNKSDTEINLSDTIRFLPPNAKTPTFTVMTTTLDGLTGSQEISQPIIYYVGDDVKKDFKPGCTLKGSIFGMGMNYDYCKFNLVFK